MISQFLCSLTRSKYLSISLLFFFFYLWSTRTAKSTDDKFYHIFFFTSANADGLPLEFEWQQVPSSLQDSSQYFGQSQQCCSLDGPVSSSLFSKPLGIIPNTLTTIDITVSLFSDKIQVFVYLIAFFFFLSVVNQNGKIYRWQILSYFFFTSANADGLPLEFEWQQVSSSLQDSSQHSGRSQ